MSFLSEEVYQQIPGQKEESVFLAGFAEPPTAWKDDSLASQWNSILDVRGHVTKKLEEARQNKLIGSGLEAHVTLTVPAAEHELLVTREQDLPSLFIVSQVTLLSGQSIDVAVTQAKGTKCARCWNYSEKTGADKRFPETCPKCVRALA